MSDRPPKPEPILPPIAYLPLIIMIGIGIVATIDATIRLDHDEPTPPTPNTQHIHQYKYWSDRSYCWETTRHCHNKEAEGDE